MNIEKAKIYGVDKVGSSTPVRPYEDGRRRRAFLYGRHDGHCKRL